jgi:diguanylate cyclase (GGDEF)-like protein
VSPLSAEQSELRAMTTRLRDAERERADALDQARMLAALQNAFTQIAVTRAPDNVLAHMLRAAREPLGFSRAIFFAADRERGIEARWQLDGSDVVEPSLESADTRPGTAMLSVLRGEQPTAVGRAGELSAPLVDVRNWYALAPVAHAEGTSGLLYVDGHRSREPRAWEVELARGLATIAGVAYQNSLQFARTKELAECDPLTGLLNRRTFAKRLLEELELARQSDRSLTYVMIDVDDFKAVNDTYGHAQGDRVLRDLSAALLRGARAHDVVGRYAGDEFVVLYIGVDRALAATLVARLSASLREQRLSCSMGAALFPQDASDAGSLLAAADRALYETKRCGKNGFRFAEASDT